MGAAQQPHALSAVCLGHFLWTGTGAQCCPSAPPAPGPGGLCWSSLLLLTHGVPWLAGPTANVSVPVPVSGSLDGVSQAPAHVLSQLGLQPGLRQVFAAFSPMGVAREGSIL